MPHKKLVVIAGPTGVGKTKLAIELAKKLDAEIFSADSRQLYKELNIGVAKPNLSELSTIRHHFIDHISIHQPYDVGTYENEVINKLNIYYKKNDVAILTGGTGLYINAVLNGIDKFPPISSSVRSKYTDILTHSGIEVLQEELKLRDPNYYSEVDIQNPRRLSRALEVIETTGKRYSDFLKKSKIKREFKAHNYLIMRERESLYDRINQRVDLMIAGGLIDEARQLYPFKNLKALQTVGYAELFSHFDGLITKEAAISLIKQNSRRYAKRQITWFKKYGNWTNLNYPTL